VGSPEDEMVKLEAAGLRRHELNAIVNRRAGCFIDIFGE
jgi:hypothetical protein